MNDRNRLKVFKPDYLQPVSSFEELGIMPEVMRYIKESKTDFKIAHEYSLPLILAKKNLFLVSPPASGRGSATMIGILNAIDFNINRVQALVLSPDKSLAEEYYENLKLFGKYTKMSSILCTGSLNVDVRQINSQVIVATCGKLMHFFRNELVDLRHLKVVVCDIANNLFKEPMLKDTELVLSRITKPCIYWYLCPKVENFIKEKFSAKVSSPEFIEILRDERLLEEFTFYAKVVLTAEEKVQFVHSLVFHSSRQVIIFGSNSEELESLNTLFSNLSCEFISSKYSKIHQKIILKDFKDEVLKVLACESKSSIIRKVQTKDAVDIVNLCIPKDNEMFIARMRRCNYHSKDIAWIVVTNEEYIELQKLAGNLSLKIILYD
jgi:superfamily II DNA/RNA helicase